MIVRLDAYVVDANGIETGRRRSFEIDGLENVYQDEEFLLALFKRMHHVLSASPEKE